MLSVYMVEQQRKADLVGCSTAYLLSIEGRAFYLGAKTVVKSSATSFSPMLLLTPGIPGMHLYVNPEGVSASRFNPAYFALGYLPGSISAFKYIFR